MSKHTPGPWKVGCYDVRFIFGGDGGLVAEACRGDAVEDFANANILAAAPDLLEAAVQASGVLAYCLAHGYIDSMATAEAKKALAGLDAAIAKATGAD